MLRILLAFITLSCLMAQDASAVVGRVTLYGTYVEPQNSSAEEFSDAGWGGGLFTATSLDPKWRVTALTFSFDVVNLLAESIDRRDPDTGLLTVTNTNQNMFRLMLGTEIGSHSGGFFRPHAGAAIGLTSHSISTTLVVPNDTPGESDLTQDLGRETRFQFGYELSVGADLNVSNRFHVEGGVRYIKSFGVTQQLDSNDAVEIHPDYFAFFLGVGLGFDTNRGAE